MNSIIVRQATNDVEAFKIANAIQSLSNCDVISVAPVKDGWLQIWAKFNSDEIEISVIDLAIELALTEDEVVDDGSPG